MSLCWLLLGVLLALLTSSARTQQSDCFYFYNPASLVVYRIPSTSSLCTNSTFTFQNWDYYRNRWKGNLTFLPDRKTISLSNNGSSPAALDEAYATSLFDQRRTVLPGNQENLPAFRAIQSSSLETGQFYWNFEGNTIDPGPLAGAPGLYLVANPNDLIIEDSGLGFFFSYYVYVVLGIAIIAAAVSPLHVSIVSIGLQTCLLFTAICSALIKIGYTEGISIALGSLVAAGLACFLVSRLEESQQFKAAQISTFISMAISLVTVSYCDLACLLVIGGIQWMVYNKKV